MEILETKSTDGIEQCPSRNSGGFKRFLIVSAVLSLTCFLIYSNSFQVPFTLDDIHAIVENPNIQMESLSTENIVNVFKGFMGKIRPVSMFSFAMNYYAGNLSLTGFHLTNILIHLINSILLFYIFSITLSRVKIPASNITAIAFSSALIWLVHPLHTQSVTYIFQRVNSLCVMFYLLSFLLYLSGRKYRSLTLYVFSAISGILAFGSKEIAITLPFFILLYEWYFFQDMKKDWLKSFIKKSLITVLPFLIIVIACLLLYYPLKETLSSFTLEGNSDSPPPLQRMITEFRVIIHYLGLIFYPNPSRLMIDYDFPYSVSFFNPFTTLLSFILISGLIISATLIARRERLISFCVLWYFGNLALESSFIPVNLVFEHRTYLPSVFIIFLTVFLIFRFVRDQYVRWLLIIIPVFFLSVWTYQRNEVWLDPVELWADNVRKAPGKLRPRVNLATAYFNSGKSDDALFHLVKANQMSPENHLIINSIGAVLLRQNKPEEAVYYFREALRIDPSFAEAHNCMGNALSKMGKFEEAKAHYAEAMKGKNAFFGKSHFAKGQEWTKEDQISYNLGTALTKEGRLSEAAIEFEKALKINPSHIEARENLAAIQLKTKNFEEALKNYNEVLRRNPDKPRSYKNLGTAYLFKNEPSKAIEFFDKAIALDNSDAETYNNAGIASAMLKNPQKAAEHFQEALRIKPDYKDALKNLQITIEQLRKMNKN